MIASALAGLTILVIGDSHLISPGSLIDSLHNALQAGGAQVQTVGVCGTNPGDWVKTTAGTCGSAERIGKAPAKFSSGGATRPIAELVQAGKPKLVVIVQGDTIGGYKQQSFPKAWAWQQTTQLTRAVAATQTACVWVGPAWGSEGGSYGKTFTRVQQLSAFLASNVSPCEYVDSLKLSKPGQWATTDGQHLTTQGYQQWGQGIASAIAALPGVQQLQSR
ncbi:SGNH/GDSL hydrolase family protein [Orrella sp. JC864]|uniref:SGNH/GDSL hydrolase family protein n=1 Tax=Orrella sp. JC864 TaxID=3120298 RepID=UPI00300AFBB4